VHWLYLYDMHIARNDTLSMILHGARDREHVEKRMGVAVME